MKRNVLIIIISLSLILTEISASPQNFLNILSQIRDQFEIDLFVTVGTQNSPLSDQLLQELEQNLSVQIIHYSNLWIAPKYINPYHHGDIVLSKFKRNFLLIGIIDGITAKDALSKQIFALTYRNPMAKVIYFLAENTTMTTTAIQALIRKCFDSDVVDVVFFQNQHPPQMFTYHPFNDLKIIKLKKVSDFFENRLMNFNKYPLRVFKYNLPPRVMESHEGEIMGYAGHLVTSYIQKRNATVEVIPRREGVSTYEQIMDKIVTRHLDMLCGVLPMFQYDIGEPSYPVLYEKFCVMVRPPKVIPVYRNFLQPFEENVWIAVICGTFYIAIVAYIVGAIVNGRKDISAAFITSICFIIARGEVGIFYNLNRRLCVLYVFLFLLGFMLSNMYCALLTTFLTTPSYEREIKTLADIAAAGLKIVGEQVEVNYLTKRDFYKKYHPLLKGLSPTEYMNVKNNLNNTNPAFISTDSFGFLNEVQKYQNDIKFQITNICPFDIYFSVFFKDESILIENFNSHALLVQQSGLLNYWKTNAFFEALRSGFLHLERGSTEFGPVQLTLVHLQVAFYILLSGLAVSISVFIAEHLYNYLIKCSKR
ncbi:unnamed protein product [Hermetia illucens]|uniref:Ionotropic receptor n=1 Tax=Hermetia illucens TaxID=343691 RepID=A0A7R8UII9_HERIL|nr:uncharacterized protein LOC119647655 [Hermetia illucens]CAD7080662.1 unnamed protein product [Hermetia illucens]